MATTLMREWDPALGRHGSIPHKRQGKIDHDGLSLGTPLPEANAPSVSH